MVTSRLLNLGLMAALAALAAGCASSAVDPAEPRANTGYVDLYSDASPAPSWQVERLDPRSGKFRRVYWDVHPPASGVVRLAMAPGPQRLRLTSLNRATPKPGEVDVVVEDGKVRPVKVRFKQGGSVLVDTKQARVGGTYYGRFGRTTKIQSEGQDTFEIVAEPQPAVPYRRTEEMGYEKGF